MACETYGPGSALQTVGFGPAYCALMLADSETLERHGSERLSDFTSAAVVCLCSAAHVLSSEQVVRVVASELVSWALGHSDPLRERVKAREREVADE